MTKNTPIVTQLTSRDSCACDVPAHTYQFSWEPNTRWSKFYAPAPEIRQYLNYVVDKHGLRKYIQVNHRAISARWQEDSSTWRVELETTNSLGDLVVVTRECDVLVKGVGTLNNWKNPEIKGLSKFGGKLMHTANWDETVDLKGKRIAVIGNGASAVQCVAALQPSKLVRWFANFASLILANTCQSRRCGKTCELCAHSGLDDTSSFLRWRCPKGL